MDTMKLIRERHSVRKYLDKAIEPEKIAVLEQAIAEINEKTGLHIQYMNCADGVYGNLLSKVIGWKNVPGYLAFVGKPGEATEEACGYYGEHLVLLAQSLGLSTCWAGMVKSSEVKAEMNPGEKLILTAAVGYGAEPGRVHKSRDIAQVASCSGDMPEWFRNGVESALLAPTAINQQKFLFTLQEDGSVEANIQGKGPFIHVDLGIVKYHFEAATGVGMQPELRCEKQASVLQ